MRCFVSVFAGVSLGVLLCACDGESTGGALDLSVGIPTPAPGLYLKTDTLPVVVPSRGDGSEVRYTLDGSEPTRASKLLGDTLQLGAPRTGESVTLKLRRWKGSDSGGVLVATYGFGIPLPSPNVASFVDERDGKEYGYAVIGGQTWMSNNLDYRAEGSDTGRCFKDSVHYCAKFGRLYTWAQVMGLPASCNESSNCWVESSRGICPLGWRVPTASDWNRLLKYSDSGFIGVVRGEPAGALKSKTGWGDTWDQELRGYVSGNGTDLFGFGASPTGELIGNAFYGGDHQGIWWSSTSYIFSAAMSYAIGSSGGKFYEDRDDKVYGFGLRCIKE